MNTKPNRRRFLKSTALVATAIASGASGRTAFADSSAGPIRKAVKYHMIQGKESVLDKFKMLRDLGYDGVEPRTRDLVDNMAEMIAAVESTGIAVHGVVNSSNPDIKTAIDAARQVGATSVLVVVPADAKGSYLQNYKKRQEIIRRAIPLAEKHGVHILVENVWASFLIEPLSMARFVDELDSPMVGVYFDVGNNVRWGYPEHWIEVLGSRIGKLDIKEYSRELQVNEGLRAGFQVEIGEGSVDWKRVREELAKIQFKGWATAEVKGGDRSRLAEIAARMDNVLQLR